jgi:hypothetical protein
MTLSGWRRLRDGGDEAVVLAVDFGPRTGQRGFAQFAEYLQVPYPFYETVPLRPLGPVAEFARSGSYLEHWGAAVAGRRVRAVLAFCSGARFAAAIAGLTGEPPVILLDPSDVSAPMLKAEFDATVESLSAQAGADTMRAARHAAREAAQGSDDLAAVADALCAQQRRIAETALLPAGMPARLVAQLCDRFAAYLGYLVAAARTPQRPGPPPALVLATGDHTVPERYREQAVQLAVRHEQLLSDRGAAALVRQCLAGQRDAGAGGLARMTSGKEGPRST